MCRLHAINNALGRSIISKRQFFEYCDEFDMHNHCRGSREFFFINSNDNIISFILNKFHVQNTYYPPNNRPNLKEDSDNQIKAVICFDNEHVWCIKKHNGTWFNLDSMSNEPRRIEFRSIFSGQEFGWIILRNNIESIPHEESVESCSKMEQHSKVESIDHLRKSSSESCSEQNYFEEYTMSDEPLLNDRRNNLNQSNRFQILSSIED